MPEFPRTALRERGRVREGAFRPNPVDPHRPGNVLDLPLAQILEDNIDTGDTRITGTVQYIGGFLYPTINTGNGGTSAVLGWQVQPFLNDNGDGHCTGAFANACPTITRATIVKEFCLFCGEGHRAAAYYGTIQPDPEGNWTMVYNFSDQNNYPITRYTSNRVTWPTPFHDNGNDSCVNSAFYGQFYWTEYLATAIDLLNTDGTPSTTPRSGFPGCSSRTTAIGPHVSAPIRTAR
jgi:hypothetical protein